MSERKLFNKWFGEGFKAGRTEKEMVIDKESLKDTFERFGGFDNVYDLVDEEINGWMELDYYWDKYGNEMLEDARNYLSGEYDKDSDEVFIFYTELVNEFWDGYIKGRKIIGVDIYKIAEEIIEKGY
jgi:hypothetical protein